MKICSWCGHDGDSDHTEPRRLCQRSALVECDACRKLDYLNYQILRAKFFLADLLDQRDGLRSLLNHAHPSIIHRMPVEVASIIFGFYATDNNSPLTLGAICRTWRHTAWSTPSLWTSLTMNITRNYMSNTRIQLAREWLSRSGQLPLSITLDKALFFPSTLDHPGFYALVDVINKHCNQWYSLDINLSSSLLAYLDDSTSTSPILHSLRISSSDVKALVISHLNQVAPHIVTFEGVHLIVSSFNWVNISHLTVTNDLYADQVLEILRSGPCLRECQFGGISTRDLSPPTDAYSCVTHHGLTTMVGRFWSLNNMELFLGAVILPALTDLNIEADFMFGLPTEALILFFTRSEMRLKRLSLDNFTFMGEDLIPIARVLTSLEYLHIGLNHEDVDELGEFYHALASHRSAGGTSQQVFPEPLLPMLRTFSWYGDGGFPWEVIPGFLVPFRQHDDARRPLTSIQIYCNREEEDAPIPYIPQDVLTQLTPFRNQVEFEFEVSLEDGAQDLWNLSLEELSKRTDSGVGVV